MFFVMNPKNNKFDNLNFTKKLIHSMWSFASRTTLQKKFLVKIGVRNIIDIAERRGYFDVYQNYHDRYWNEIPDVIEYINKNATGNKNASWQKDILTRFKGHIPFKKVLVIGCGNGWVERELYDLGIGLYFEAFDISDKFLKTAKSLVANRKIHYFTADLNNLEGLERASYDAIINVSVLHHIDNISKAQKMLSEILKPDGLIFNYEYVGPNRYQYSDKHLSILKQINKQLPKRFQSQYPLRPLSEDFELGDKMEAISSEAVQSTFKQFFDLIYERDLMGGIAYQILWNNIIEFQKNDNEAKKALKFLLEKDSEYTNSGKIPNLHWYSIGKPKVN